MEYYKELLSFHN